MHTVTRVTFILLLTCLTTAPLHAYQSDRVKKTVISSNIEEQQEETPVLQTQSPGQTTPTKVSPVRPSAKPGQPAIKRLGVSFAYHDLQNPKPSVPYLRLYLDDETSVDISFVFRNINRQSNYSLLDFSFLKTIHSASGLLVRTGAGVAVYSDPSTTYLLSYILGLEKEIVPGVSLGVIYEPCVFSSDSDTGTSLLMINGSFSTRLTWQL